MSSAILAGPSKSNVNTCSVVSHPVLTMLNLRHTRHGSCHLLLQGCQHYIYGRFLAIKFLANEPCAERRFDTG